MSLLKLNWDDDRDNRVWLKAGGSMEVFLLFIALLFIGATVLAVAITSSAVKSSNVNISNIVGWREETRNEYGFPESFANPKIAIALNVDRKEVAILKIGEGGLAYPMEYVAAVELTPIYTTTTIGSSETRTKRGSQMISAVAGGALAGPAGFVVGGLSGKQSTQSFTSSNQSKTSVELKVRLRSDIHPIVIVESGIDMDMAERIAARIANSIESNRAPKRSKKIREIPPGRQSFEPARGWWQRTFAG